MTAMKRQFAQTPLNLINVAAKRAGGAMED